MIGFPKISQKIQEKNFGETHFLIKLQLEVLKFDKNKFEHNFILESRVPFFCTYILN